MTFQQSVPYISALFAGIAAVLAGVNLWRTDKREHLTWVRLSLETALVDFLTASYNHRGACKHIVQLRLGEDSRRGEKEWRRLVRDSHETMLANLSRIRVLTTEEMTETARDLMRHNVADEESIAKGDYEALRAMEEERREAFRVTRDTFVARTQEWLEIKPR